MEEDSESENVFNIEECEKSLIEEVTKILKDNLESKLYQ